MILLLTSLTLEEGITTDWPPARLEHLTSPLSKAYRPLLLRVSQLHQPVHIVVNKYDMPEDPFLLPSKRHYLSVKCRGVDCGKQQQGSTQSPCKADIPEKACHRRNCLTTAH